MEHRGLKDNKARQAPKEHKVSKVLQEHREHKASRVL